MNPLLVGLFLLMSVIGAGMIGHGVVYCSGPRSRTSMIVSGTAILLAAAGFAFSLDLGTRGDCTQAGGALVDGTCIDRSVILDLER